MFSLGMPCWARATADSVPVGHGFEEVALGPVTEFAQQKRRVVSVAGLKMLVIYHRRWFTVVENRCPHLGARLDHARISMRTLTCTAHFCRHSLVDGKPVPTPRCGLDHGGQLTMFTTRVVDGRLYAVVDRARLVDWGAP